MAEVVPSRAARWAGVAGDAGLDRHPVAGLEVVGFLGDCARVYDLAGGFVAQEDLAVDGVPA